MNNRSNGASSPEKTINGSHDLLSERVLVLDFGAQ